MTTLTDKAVLFRALHTGGSVLALPNAWDVASARLIEEAGAKAIATTSAGVAWSLGAADGDELDRDRALDLISRLAGAVAVPVTADIESGFAAGPEGVAETVRGVIAAGAVGINLEDAHHRGPQPLRAVAEQCERIAAARQAAEATKFPLFINARVDTYLRGAGDPPTRLQDTLDRAAAYVAAGADGVFVPGVVDKGLVADLVKGLTVPLNVLAGPGAPTIAEFGALGVARVSLGSSVAQAAYAVARDAARELFTTGTYAALERDLDYEAINSLLH
jgi:2-methylisocitrate lyase-like PEP mutase family enzyme